MIVKTIQGDVLKATERHVCFAVNVEGANDSGLAGAITRGWPELRYAMTGDEKPRMGQVFSREVGDHVFHGIVCHSLAPGGWDGSAAIIRKCLDEIWTANGERIACVLFGDGLIGRIQGADAEANRKAMENSVAEVVLYRL